MMREDLIKIVEEDETGKFGKFSEILLRNNEKINLTSVTDSEEVKIKHFWDSVALEEFFPQWACVLEVGSGGGFPSIPLKIVRDDLKFVLVESNERKCRYLRDTLDELGLSNMHVVCARAELLGKNPHFREQFDVCCARAVAKMSQLCELCLPFVKVGGIFVAYKGPSEDCADVAISTLGGKIERNVFYSLPEGMGERSGLLVTKVFPTPDRFPRSGGAIEKRPL